jgi:hypothetical protein
MAETRAQFLAWAKDRALFYVDNGLPLADAWASLLSDLQKNPEVFDCSDSHYRAAILEGQKRLMDRAATAGEMRRLIEDICR